MSLKLVALYPEHLNLNGDLANLLVLQKRAIWHGVAAEIITVAKGETIPADAAVILLGHGSAAAWQDISDDLDRMFTQIDRAVSSGAQLIAIASGYELAIMRGFFDGDLTTVERISKFEIAELASATGAQKVLGYLNAASKAPVIQENSKGLGTQLHGPVLAKNAELADKIWRLAAKRRNLEESTRNNEALDRAAELVSAAWELEEDLARE